MVGAEDIVGKNVGAYTGVPVITGGGGAAMVLL